MDKVRLHKTSCKVIDVTNKRGTVETLTETKISCSLDEKVWEIEQFPKLHVQATAVHAHLFVAWFVVTA